MGFSKKDKNGSAEKKSQKQRIIFGANALILIAVVIVVAVLLNIVVEQIPMNLDLTEEKLFTLTETTENVLAGIEEDISIYALYDRVEGENDTTTADVIKVLDLYDSYDNIEVSYVDLDKKPAFLTNTVGANSAGDYSEGDYIVKCGDRTRRIDGDDMFALYEETYMYIYTQNIVTGLQVETKVTGAIVRVTSDVPVVYWSVDFGETESSSTYYSEFVEAIEDSNYDIKEISLKTDEIPEDASAIIFMSPTEDLTGEAADKLIDWFNDGGKAFFFMDVEDAQGNRIYASFKKFSLCINNDIIDESDEYKYASDSDSIFKTTTLTAGSLEKAEATNVYVLNTRSISILDTADDYQEPEAIMATSNEATAVSLEEEDDTSVGKKIIAASSQKVDGTETSQIVVFGSSGNVQSSALAFFGNSAINVVKDSLEWMDIETVENPADSIEAKSYNSVMSSIVDVTEKETKVIAIIVAIVIPVIILIIGLVVWLRRRHL